MARTYSRHQLVSEINAMRVALNLPRKSFAGIPTASLERTYDLLMVRVEDLFAFGD